MKQVYEKLYEACHPYTYRMSNVHYKFDQLSHFVASCGPKYHDEDVRLMVVGRATNGWDSLPCDDKDAFGCAAEEAFGEPGFGWLVDSNDGRGLHNNEEDTYYLSSSAFWRTIKSVWEQLSGKSEDRWVDYIAWSNIYKAAPKNDTPETRYNDGNPSTKLCRKQLRACHEIMKIEIESFDPTHILFITGWDWIYDWLTDFGRINLDVIPKDPPIGKNAHNDIFVEGFLEYELNERIVPVAVACRPEYRDEQAYASQIVSWLSRK